VDKTELIQATVNIDGFYDDLVGLGIRVLPNAPISQSVDMVAEFLVENQGVITSDCISDPRRQFDVQPQVKSYTQIVPAEYLKRVKALWRKWAAMTPGQDALDSWLKAQTQFAGIIYSHIQNQYSN